MKNICLNCSKTREVNEAGYCQKCYDKVFKESKYKTKKQELIYTIEKSVILIIIIAALVATIIYFKDDVLKFCLSIINIKTTVPVTSESVSSKNIEFFEGTNVPTPESVLGYGHPLICTNELNTYGLYYGAYGKEILGIEQENYVSIIKSTDYDTYSKVLTQNNFAFKSTSKDDEATIYEYENENANIRLRIKNDSFEITIQLLDEKYNIFQ